MKRKLTKSKAPLSRRKVQDQDEPVLNATVENDGLEVTKTVVSPKSKCYRKPRLTTASSSNDDPCQTSAFDYNSGEDTCTTVKDKVTPFGIKRKRESSKDEESTSLPGTSRYKKSQQAINLIKNSGEKEKKYGKKRKGRKNKSSTSSDEEDFDQPLKKANCLFAPDIELSQLTSTLTRGRSKKSLLNLKKNKRNAGTDDLQSEESNVDSATESGTVNQKKYSESAEDDADGDDERDDDPDDDDEKDGIGNFEPHNNKQRTQLEKELEAAKETTVKTSEIKCPICSQVFDEFTEQEKINEHVNSCLDSKATTTAATEIQENNPKSSLSILKVQLVDFEYHRKEVGGYDLDFDGEDGLYFCQICQKDLSKMNSQRRQQHINKCCDQVEKVSEEEKVQATETDVTKKTMLSCPFCSQVFKSRKSWQAHLKKCAQENNVPPSQLIEIAKQQEQYQQEIESTSHQTEERVKGRPNEDGKKTTHQARKKRKVGKDLRDVDEETQLAMALSASMAPPAPPGNDGRKPKRKRKKENEVIPALLLRSKEETQNVIAARAAQVVCNKDDDSEEDSISCTPALAPSTLAEQFLKVEQANANIIVQKEAKDQATECTKAGITETTNQDKQELKVKEEDTLCTPDTSSKAVFEDTAVVLLSDMLASPDMCRSFLSFLDVPDEEDTTAEARQETSDKPTIEVNKDPSEQPGMSVMVGCSAPLWSMASLGNPESSTKDFYVPGLLQMPSPKPPKKTPRKSSGSIQRKVSARVEAQEEVAKTTEKSCKEDMIFEKEETPDKLNKTMSESELTTASQVANLDILLELIDDGNDDDSDDDGIDDKDDDDSQEQSRKSSVNHDEDEVFPSSGFCLPVGPNNQPDKADSNVPSSLSLFLQDMSKMVGNKMLSDVTILTQGDESIPAHSFMLASRSQILANMIREAQNVTDGQQPTDNKPVQLSFSDVEPDAMRCILQYIYTASVNVPQSCMDDVLGLADRLELFELVKACQYSKTIHEEAHEKQGSEDQEDNDIRCSLSAEQLLDAIWQDGAEGMEAKQDKQEESQDEWNEPFDDDDIEEVRIFQTQAVRKRTCSEDTRQEPLEEILHLEARNEDVQVFTHTPSETDDSDSMMCGVEDEELQLKQNETESNYIERREVREILEAKDGKDDHLHTTVETDFSESKQLKGKELKHQKDDISYRHRKDVSDDERRYGTRDHGERDFGKRDTTDDQGPGLNCEDEAKQDKCGNSKEKEQSLMSDIQMTDIMSYDVYDDKDNHDSHSVHGKVDLTEDDDDGRDDADENNESGCDHHETNQGSVQKGQVDLTEDDDDAHDDDDDQIDVQDCDKNTSQNHVKLNNFNLIDDDEDAHDDDDENNEPAKEGVTTGKSMNAVENDLTDEDERDHRRNGRKTSRVSNLNVNPKECNKYRNIDEESKEHENYKSINEESEEEYGAGDIAILDQSINLLSDDNDCQSPEKSPDNLVIPETPHPKKRQRHPVSEGDQRCMTPPSDSPISYSPPPDYVTYDVSNEDDGDHVNQGASGRDNVLNEDDNDSEEDHVSEDEEAFMEKLKSRVHAKAKHAEKEKKKGKGKKKSPENRSRRNKSTKDAPKRLRSSPSSRRVSKAKNNPRVVDVSMDNKIEDLINESASNQFESDLEQDTSLRDDSRSNKDDQESCSSLSPPRMLSPRAPSPCYSDFDHDMPSPSVSPTNPDGTVTAVNHSPVTTTPMQRYLTELQTRSPKAMDGAEGTVETRLPVMSQRMAVLIKEKALDSDQESEISDDAALLSESAAHGDGKTDDQEKRTVEEDSDRQESKVSPGRPVLVHNKPLDSDQESEIGDDVALLPVAEPISDDRVKKTFEEKDDERRISRQSPVHQEEIESDQEGELNDLVALLPEPETHEGGKNQDGENKNSKLEEHNQKGKARTPTRFKISGGINTKSSLFKRLQAAKYGLESTETEVSSDDESVESGLDSTPKTNPGSSQPDSQKSKSQETTSHSPIPSQNDFYDDGGYNCDADDFGACLDGDDSFMAYAAEQMELIDKQDKPVTQEKPVRQVELAKPWTPAQAQRLAAATPRNSRAQDTSTDSPITPMPNYDDMTTPDLKVEVNKFGVRALPKKKMKAKLIEIYQYTHPGATVQTQDIDNTKKKTSKSAKVPAKVPTRTAKPSSKTVASSQPAREPAKRKRIAASQVRRQSSSSDDDVHQLLRPSSQRPASVKPSTFNASKDLQRKAAPDTGVGSSRGCSSSQPASTSKRIENNAIESASSLSDDERGTGRGSSEGNNEEQEEFGEVSILVDRETDTASQQVNSDNLETKLLSFIESHQDIYLKVLSYQPIDLMALHELIKSSGIKCRVGQLIDFLDTQGITFTTAGQKPRQRRKPPRKKR